MYNIIIYFIFGDLVLEVKNQYKNINLFIKS